MTTRDAFEAWWESNNSLPYDDKFGVVRDGLEIWKAAIATEREACAQVCTKRNLGDGSREDQEAVNCANAIKRRGDA